MATSHEENSQKLYRLFERSGKDQFSLNAIMVYSWVHASGKIGSQPKNAFSRYVGIDEERRAGIYLRMGIAQKYARSTKCSCQSSLRSTVTGK